MPRHTHPAPVVKHDRGHVRFHRDRKVKLRARRYQALHPWWVEQWGDWYRDRITGPWGRLDNEDWWMGCHRSGCGICHDSWSDGERVRDERLALRYENFANGSSDFSDPERH